MLRGPHPLSIDDKNLLNRLVMTLLYICTLIPSCVQCICVIAFVLDLKKGQDPDKKKGRILARKRAGSWQEKGQDPDKKKGMSESRT